MKDGDQSSQE
jgi:hypothetical protein